MYGFKSSDLFCTKQSSRILLLRNGAKILLPLFRVQIHELHGNIHTPYRIHVYIHHVTKGLQKN